MKTEILKALGFMLVGAFLWSLKPSKPQEASQVQQQQQECKVLVTKITKPDGTVQETSEISASSNQSQVVKPQSDKKHSISYIPKYNFNDKSVHHSAIYTYNNLGIYASSNKEIGLVLKLDF